MHLKQQKYLYIRLWNEKIKKSSEIHNRCIDGILDLHPNRIINVICSHFAKKHSNLAPIFFFGGRCLICLDITDLIIKKKNCKFTDKDFIGKNEFVWFLSFWTSPEKSSKIRHCSNPSSYGLAAN